MRRTKKKLAEYQSSIIRHICLLGLVSVIGYGHSFVTPDMNTDLATYSLDDAQPADNLFHDSEERFLIKFICSGIGSIDTLIFGDMRLNVTQSRPAILAKTDDKWLVLPFEGDLLQQSGWEYVGSTHDRTQMFAVLDNQIESPGWDLVILASSDGGRTWTLRSTLRKVCYYAGFHDFVMDRKGRGRLTILLNDDYHDDITEGLYHYRTSDGGCTWTGPEHEPNYIYKRSSGIRTRTIQSLCDLPD